jgi:DNA-binding winged helix-turn-helix (wHTH) protein/Tol biopolymer transport system component
MSEPPISPRMRFGPFELDPSSGQLRKDGTLIRLQPQPFRLLQLLAERAGRVVSREEIRLHLWADSTFVDFEHGINFSINQIRAALSDNAEKPRFIETLPRRGYRFLGPVEPQNGREPLLDSFESSDDFPVIDTATFQLPSIGPHTSVPVRSVPHPAPPPPIPPPRGRLLRRWFSIAALVVLGSFAGFVVRHLVYPHVPRVLRLDQLTQSGRVDPWGRIVSDGSRLFYLERQADHWITMQTAAAGGESQPFPGPFPNTKIFAISPDTSRLLVAPFTTASGSLPLWSLPLVGGTPRRLAALVANDVTYSPDGTQLALATPDGIFLSQTDGSNLRRLLYLPGENNDIAWSPNSRLLRFTHAEPTAGSLIFEVSSEGQNLRLLFPSSAEIASACCGRWTLDGAYFVFTGTQNGRSDLWALQEPPLGISWLRRKPSRLTSGPFSYVDGLPAAQGNALYAHGSAEWLEILRLDPKSSATAQLLPGEGVREVDFSPDGRWLLYTAAEGLWRSRPDGSDRQLLAANPPGLGIHDPCWRPDSKFILFSEPQSGKNRIYLVSAEGGAPRSILDAKHPRDRPDWSPDGRSLVFSILDDPQPGRPAENGVYFFELENGRTTKVPDSAGLFAARWSPDGRYLAAVSADADILKLYDIPRAHWTVVATGKKLTPPVWSSDAKYIYFQDAEVPGQPLSRLRLQDSAIERVFSFEPLLKSGVVGSSFLGFTPDGSFLVRASSRAGNLYKLKLDLR